MANWQRTINVVEVWKTRDVHAIATAISEQLRKMKPIGDQHVDWTRDELADQFSELAGDADTDVEDFDCIMSELYDWGDTKLDGAWNGKAVCFVRTF